MRNMKQRLLAFCLALVVCCTATGAIVAPVSAVDVLKQCDANNSQCAACNNPDATQTPVICGDNQTGSSNNPLLGKGGLLTNTIKILSLIVGIAAIIVIIISGIRTVISAGDANSVAAARRAIIYALIGLAVAAMAQAIVAFVLNKSVGK